MAEDKSSTGVLHHGGTNRLGELACREIIPALVIVFPGQADNSRARCAAGRQQGWLCQQAAVLDFEPLKAAQSTTTPSVPSSHSCRRVRGERGHCTNDEFT